MNAARTELQKLQRAQITNLVELQEGILAGAPKPLPDGKKEFIHWHPRIPAFGLLQRPAGRRSVWVLQYRTKAGVRRTLTIRITVLLKHAEKIALDALKEVDGGGDPVGNYKKQREDSHRTVGALCEEYCQYVKENQKLDPAFKPGPGCLKQYRNVFENHLGELRPIRATELWKNQNLIVKHLKAIAEMKAKIESGEIKAKRNKGRSITGGPRVANALHSAMQSAYKYGISAYPDDIKTNPMNGILVPNIPKKTRARCLSMQELGAVWRALETMAAAPARYLGRYLEAPIPKNSVRHPETLLPLQKAARQSGYHLRTLRDAIFDGRLKAIRKAKKTDRANRRPENEYARYLVSQEELDRFTGVRLDRMRSPHAEQAAIVRLLMLLGCRYAEIGGLRWSELGQFDDEENFTPSPSPQALFIKAGVQADGRRTKTGKSLILYLPQLARDILAKVQPRPGHDLLFGSGSTRGLINNDRLKKEIDRTIIANEGAPIAPWRIHDLRHSFTTHLKQKLRILPHIVEAMTNHLSEKDRAALPVMAGHYTHGKYMDQQEPALEAWANKILEAAHPEVKVPDKKVTQLFPQSA